MICTRKTTIKLPIDLALDPATFERLSLDELGDLVERIETETQVLNRIRRVVGKVFLARLDGPLPRPGARVRRGQQLKRRA